MTDDQRRTVDFAVANAKERSTCSTCLARTYRHEECLCDDGGDAADYGEALQEELNALEDQS